MSLFSLDNILVHENNRSDTRSIDINNITSTVDNENYSFVKESYTFVLGYTKEWNEANKTFYQNILESNDSQQIITESFSDFFSKAKEIIKKFIEFIKKIFREFAVKLNGLFKSEKYLIKNKSEFAKFTSDDEFEFNGYNFTELYNHTIPKSEAAKAFYTDSTLSIRNYNFSDMSVDDIKKYGNTENYLDSNNPFSNNDKDKEASLKKYVDDKYKELQDRLDDYYDWFRGDVIGKSPISSSDYADELRKVFRNDEADSTDITIDASFVNEAYNRFDGYKKLIKSIEETKKAIEKDYNKLRDALEKSVKFEKDGNGVFFKFNPSSSYDYANTQTALFGPASDDKIATYSSDVNNKIDMYIKAKINQVQQMSSIHTLAFSAKLQAAKDCFVQDKKILYKALAKIKAHKPD